MTPRELIASFDLLADAPDGVKRLRELVLSLAVRGKLVEQDPADEPADKLLNRIAANVPSKRRPGRANSTEPVDSNTTLPKGWAIARLTDLCSKIGAGSTPLGGAKVYVDDGVMFLRSQNVWNDGLRLDDVARIEPATHERMAGTHVRPLDILFNITGASIGRCVCVPATLTPANVSQHVTIIRLQSAEMQRFVHVVLCSDVTQQRVFQEEVGVSREGLSVAKLSQFPIPVPPLAEQHRIVARVDELMALLDRLEAAHKARDEARRAARDAALAALRDAPDADAVETAWARIAEQMDELFAGPEDVASLQPAILHLAVRGLLLPCEIRWFPLAELLREPLANGRSVPDGSGYPVLRLTALRGSTVDTQHRKLGNWDVADGRRFRIEAGDLLVVRGNGSKELVARAAMVLTTEEVAFPDTAIRIRPNLNLISQRYLYYSWEAPVTRVALEGRAKTTAGIWKVSQDDLYGVSLPVPPLEEQHRIVAKVDALLALCDTLESRLRTARELHAQFAAAAAHHLDV